MILHYMGQYADEMGIELGSCGHSQYSERDSISYCLIGNARDLNGFKSVGHRKNPGAERDKLSPDAVWIPRSIPPFVMMRNED